MDTTEFEITAQKVASQQVNATLQLAKAIQNLTRAIMNLTQATERARR